MTKFTSEISVLDLGTTGGFLETEGHDSFLSVSRAMNIQYSVGA